MNSTSTALLDATQALCTALAPLRFSPPVTHVYNPLLYAEDNHRAYVERYAKTPKRVVFLGMNPGPFGMVQTGIPFGEVDTVKNWLKLTHPVHAPARENPKRPILGLDCPRSEVSGRRLWGLFRERFGTPEAFFEAHFVLNYCPLAFFNEGRNVTPDKLPVSESAPLLAACDAHLRAALIALSPEWVIGVGAWAAQRAQKVAVGLNCKTGRILHPSPASPAANRGWAAAATEQLESLGVWCPAQ